jgi:hypothetical protein
MKGKHAGWTVDQIGDAHKQNVAKSVSTVLERETKLDPKAVEAVTHAVQSILLRQVGSIAGEILNQATSGVSADIGMSSCTTHACSGNGVISCGSRPAAL